MNNKNLSVVIPCFNEEKRVVSTLYEISDYFTAKGIQFEILIVDDGSTDSTVDTVSKLSNKMNNIRIYRNQSNMGKGYSVGLGVFKSSGNYILFTDADMSTPIDEFEKFILHINHGEKIMIGSRKMNGANIVTRQPFLREFLGKVFTKLSNLILGTNYSDFTCGFKCFETDIAKKIFSKRKINRWGFDSEILFLAKKLKYKVIEIPITWRNDLATKVDLKKDILNSFVELIKIRIIHRA